MKTLKEILHERHPKNFNCLHGNQVIELMQFVREQTLIECAEKAELMHVEDLHTGTVAIDKNSILSLDKNSLDL